MTLSKPAMLSRGVLQGSVLGPVLFTTYTIPIDAICKRQGVKYPSLNFQNIIFKPKFCEEPWCLF